MHFLTDRLYFPPPDEADEEGLLAVGGDLSPARLLLAYRSGIFPWFGEDDPPLWWCPDPRFVLFPEELKVSKSMRVLLKKGAFDFRVDTAFSAVIGACRHTPRDGQDGTWITDEIVEGYTALHRAGNAHSAEAWQDGKLVGGLYGVLLGKIFFGESMFSHVSNASKYAFVRWVELLREKGVRLIDCQVPTAHLASLGARGIPRTEFLRILHEALRDKP